MIFRTTISNYGEPFHSKRDLLNKHLSFKEVTPNTAPHIKFIHPLATALVDKLSGRTIIYKYDK